jgi:ABC-type spermidine/putrescine transport system permease subunit II
MYLAWSLAPVALLVRAAFTDPEAFLQPEGFSIAWFRAAVADPELRVPLAHSLQLAGLTVALAVPIGLALGVGLARWMSPIAGVVRALAIVPLAIPQIVMATGLFFSFLAPLRFVGLGRDAQLLGHVTIALPYVVLVMWVRLIGVGRGFEEIAMDLGASRTQALRRVTLPLLAPAILSAIAIAFVLSFDNLVLSQCLCISDCQTVPLLLYGRGRVGALSPAVVALGVMAMLGSLAAMGLFFGAWRIGRRWRVRTA